MKKQELINKILEQKKYLFDNFKFDEKNLKKCNKRDLIQMSITYSKIRVIEVMDIEEVEKIICGSCENCLKLLELAKERKSKVLLGLDEFSKYHILGVN
jgi:hypothetical protein